MAMIFPKDINDQKLRLQRFFMGLVSYCVCLGVVCYFMLNGQLGLKPVTFTLLALFCLVYNIAIFMIIRTGLNKRFKDPSLTFPQIVVAIALLLCVAYYSDANRTILLPFFLVAFVFGVFGLQTGQLMLLILLTLVGYGFVVTMLHIHRPQSMNLPLEVMSLIILATVLPWFSIIVGYISSLRTSVQTVNRSLKTSAMRYRSLFENMMDIVLIVDSQHRVTIANPLFYSTTGIDPGEAFTTCDDFIHPEDLARVESELLARLPEKETITGFQFRIMGRGGAPVYVECNARCIKNEGQESDMQLVLRDITLRKRLEEELKTAYDHLANTREVTIMGLAKLAEYRDKDTGGHLERIREYSRLLAEGIADHPEYRGYVTQEYIEALCLSSILHDIGKVAIPDSILLKPAKLDRDEFEVIKQHATLGGDAIKEAEAQIRGKSFLTIGKEIAYYHHEKWDGTGYPAGLSGSRIPLSARIVALADVYDALTTNRIYKKAYSHEKAKEIIVNNSGTHFDPDIVDAFCRFEEKFKRISSSKK